MNRRSFFQWLGSLYLGYKAAPVAFDLTKQFPVSAPTLSRAEILSAVKTLERALLHNVQKCILCSKVYSHANTFLRVESDE